MKRYRCICNKFIKRKGRVYERILSSMVSGLPLVATDWNILKNNWQRLFLHFMVKKCIVYRNALCIVSVWIDCKSKFIPNMTWYVRWLWALLLLLLCQEVESISVSMRGGEYITYEITKDTGIHTESLHIVFQFKTIDPSSLLLFSKNTYTGDFISIELLDGKIQ